MQTRNRRRWTIIRGYTIGWIAAFVFLAIVRGSGTTEEGSANFGMGTALALAVGFGLALGALAGWAQVRIEERLYRRVPLRRLLTARLLAAVVFLLLIHIFGFLAVHALRDDAPGPWEFATEPGSLAIVFYILCADVFLVSLRQVNLLLGEGNLWRLIVGEFYTPREEERIFMFVDLRSSTTLAERLGHVRYSMLIQDCFDDLGVVAEHGARIYQYVGDGAVLTWDLESGTKDANCLAAYFRFAERLSERKPYYRDHYQCAPTFTAGVNVGTVTVTEVGRFKREIAFHGDTINTASRIQGQCRELGRNLLISEALLEKLPPGGREISAVGAVSLRGKDQPVSIYSVSTPESPPRG